MTEYSAHLSWAWQTAAILRGQLWVDKANLLNLAGLSHMSGPSAGMPGLTQLYSMCLEIHQTTPGIF